MARWKPIGIILIVIVLTVWGGFIFAQPPPSSPRPGEAPERDPRMEQAIDMMFRDMDTNHDGRISKSEWMAFQEKQFNLLDKNKDGFITKDEVRADLRER